MSIAQVPKSFILETDETHRRLGAFPNFCLSPVSDYIFLYLTDLSHYGSL
jgi:hypothetical protein